MTMRHKIVLSSFIFALFSAAPAAAQNECGAQANLGDPETIDCDPGDYATGITYSSDGDLTLEVPDDTVDLNVFDQGIAVTGNGDDNIAWDSSDFTSGDIVGSTDGDALIDYRSTDGGIDIEIGGAIAAGTDASHAIYAESSNSGAIDIEAHGNVGGGDVAIEALTDGNIDIVAHGTVGAGTTAIRAVSAGGDIDVTTHGWTQDAIILDTSGGSGTLDLNVHGIVSGFLQTPIQVTSGTGLMTVNIHDGGRISSGGMSVVSGGDAEINLLPGSQVQISSVPGIDMNPAVGTVTTLNSETLVDTSGVGGLTSDRVAFVGGGDGEIVVNNAGGLFGSMDFSGNNGGVVFNNLSPATHPNAEGWTVMGDTSGFGAGNDVVNNLPGALVLSAYNDTFSEFSDEYPDEVLQASIDFGSGEDLFDNDGILAVGAAGFRAPSQFGASVNSAPRAFGLELANLEEFDNSGLIVLGSWAQRDNPRVVTAQDEPICYMPGVNCAKELLGDTDGEYSDVLSMPGTAFDGGDDSAILLDAALSLGTAQTNCQDRAPREGMFRLPGADCMDLSGGSTSGTTEIIVRDRYPGDVGANNPGIVVVDVSGGESAAEHFTLSPESDGYDAAAGGIDKGLFLYTLGYDAATQQHKLIGLPGGRALRMPLLVQAAQAASRTATDGWFDRRRETRDESNGSRGGVWARLNHTAAERDANQSISVPGSSVDFDNSYDQDTTALTFGRDFIFGEGSAWMLGGSLGYTRSRLAFGGSAVNADFDGVNLGVHGGYRAGALFVDAMLHGAWLQMNYDDPAFSDPADDNNDLRTDAETLGARAEAGWRFALGDNLRVEPLAGLSWMSTEIDGMRITSADVAGRPDNTVFGGDASTSLRGGVGARLRFDQSLEGLRLGYSLTGRVWEEMDGETDVLIRSAGPDATVSDEFDGSFSEVVGGLELTNAAGTVSGHLNVDAVFGDDYDSTGIEAGFRYRW